MRFLGALIAWIVIGVIVYFVVAFTGAYPVGADVPHWAATSRAIGFLREHTIERRVAGIKPPPLDDPALIKLGAQHYQHMCVGCHLSPGEQESELREGLYPRPPNLTRFAPDPAEAFWIIKHGLKMTAMPAWGKTHDDHKIWAMVAYLQKQPGMSAAEFHALTADGDAGLGAQDLRQAVPPMAPAPAAPVPRASVGH